MYSNCLNGGTCRPTSDNFNYICICLSGYFGIKCQSQNLNSDIFVGSSILSPPLGVQLKNLIQFPNETTFTLIYQASKDGFGLKDFHSKCDNIPNTLMIIQTTDSFILGGFSKSSWSLNNKTTNTDTYNYDSNAFIFSLTNALTDQKDFKMNVNKPDFAIYSGSDHVVNIMSTMIGFGQSDLLLNDYSNVNINYAWYNEYLSFDLPDLLAGNSSLLVGGDSFFTSQIEVFVVDGEYKIWS